MEARRSHILVPTRVQMGAMSRNFMNEHSFIDGVNMNFADGLGELPTNWSTSMPSTQLPIVSSSIERIHSSSLNRNIQPFRSSSNSAIPSQQSPAIYGLSKVSLTTLWMRLYPSMNFDIGQDSIFRLVTVTTKYIDEYIKERLQLAETLEEMILHSAFIGIKINWTSQNSNVCTESLYLYCIAIHFSSEVELLRLESYSELQIKRYRFLLMNYLSTFFSASVDGKGSKKLFLDILQSSDDEYLIDTIDTDVTLLDKGYNPFVTQNGASNQLSLEKKFGDMIKTPMWFYFLTTLFVLVGAICHIIRSYWYARQTSLLKTHVDTAVCALEDINVEVSDVII